MNIRTLTLAAFVACASAASAVELNLAGNTTGSSFTFTQNPGGLSYEAGRFNTTTVGGAYSLGSVDVTDNSLGRFVLSSTTGTYAGAFSLVVNFTAPTGITPSSTAIYSAVLSGTLTTTGSSVFVDFDNTPKTFSFSNGNEKGTFTLRVEDVALGRPASGNTIVALSGRGFANVTTSAVPGPGAMAAFGVGLIANVRRRRRSA